MVKAMGYQQLVRSESRGVRGQDYTADMILPNPSGRVYYYKFDNRIECLFI